MARDIQIILREAEVFGKLTDPAPSLRVPAGSLLEAAITAGIRAVPEGTRAAGWTAYVYPEAMTLVSEDGPWGEVERWDGGWELISMEGGLEAFLEGLAAILGTVPVRVPGDGTRELPGA